jgi:hypothetical protein
MVLSWVSCLLSSTTKTNRSWNPPLDQCSWILSSCRVCAKNFRQLMGGLLLHAKTGLDCANLPEQVVYCSGNEKKTCSSPGFLTGWKATGRVYSTLRLTVFFFVFHLEKYFLYHNRNHSDLTQSKRVHLETRHCIKHSSRYYLNNESPTVSQILKLLVCTRTYCMTFHTRGCFKFYDLADFALKTAYNLHVCLGNALKAYCRIFTVDGQSWASESNWFCMWF